MFVVYKETVEVMGTPNTMPACNHEEADYRIMVHLKHAVDMGLQNFKIKTNDTDVIVILIGMIYKFPEGINIWASMGTGSNYSLYNINAI